MASSIGSHAREFEVLVMRGIRRGVLDARELLDTYVALQPASHPELGNRRRFDLAAVVGAMRRLPRELWSAPTVRVVPRLAHFTARPLEVNGVAAGVLDDGTVLLEARFGVVSIMGLAASLCAVLHERDKALELLAPLAESLAASELGPTPSSVALALGLDEASFLEGCAATGDALLTVLDHDFVEPRPWLHPALEPRAIAERGAARGRAVVAALAEMGLFERPLHVWLGNPVITDCLSPYPRELREPLLRWASTRPAGLGADLGALEGPHGEDAVYAIAHDLIQVEPQLVGERIEADRTVGIQHRESDGLGFEVIDLARVDPSLCDARLFDFVAPEDRPVLLRLPIDLEDHAGALLRELLGALATRVASVTVVMEGSVLSGAAGTLAAPRLVVRWAGDEKLVVPGLVSLDDAVFSSFSSEAPRAGAVLSLPSASLLSSAHLDELVARVGVSAIEVGASGVIETLADAAWSGRLGQARLSLALVASRSAETGRSSVDTLTGCAGVALALLRGLASPPPYEEAPAPAPQPEPTPRRPKSSGRAMRIKA